MTGAELVPAAPAPRDIETIAAEVEDLEGRSTLDEEEFGHYFDVEVELEQQLLEYSTALEMQLRYAEAGRITDQVIELNRTLLERCDRELERVHQTDPGYVERLRRSRDLTEGTILLLQGVTLEHQANQALTGGDLATTAGILQEADRYYSELRDSELSHGWLGGLRSALCTTSVEFLNALAAMKAARFEMASETFRAARVRYQLLLDEIDEAETAADASSLPEILRQARSVVSEKYTYARLLQAMTQFFVLVQGGNTADALVHGQHVVTLGDEWLNLAVGTGQPQIQQTLRRMELANYRGWFAWAEAERAVDTRDWDGCDSRIREARDRWSECNDLAVRSRMMGGLSNHIEMGQMELLLNSTSRRARNERQLLAEIDQLRQESREIRSTHVYAQGGTSTMSTGSTSNSFNVGGNVYGHTVGVNAQSHGGSAQNTSTEVTAENLRVLADQLGTVADQLDSGARDDEERAAAAQVRQAAEVARRGDEGGAHTLLRGAGRWALQIAQTLGLAAAEAAITAAIGA